MLDSEATKATTVLIVEDDRDLLQLMALLLEAEGFTVLSAASPVDAIAIMARETG